MAAEIIFDQGLGDLVVVRTAGHVVDAGIHAPLDYIGAEHVRGTARLLVDRSHILGEAVHDRSCLVLGATYRLADGRVRPVSKEV